MKQLTQQLLDEIVAACRAAAAEATESLKRELEVDWRLEFDATKDQEPGCPRPGEGLALVWIAGPAHVALALPGGEGGLPTWCADPDPTGQSKLATVAQELGMLLLPETYAPEEAGEVVWLEDLTQIAQRFAFGQDAVWVPGWLVSEEKTVAAGLLVGGAEKNEEAPAAETPEASRGKPAEVAEEANPAEPSQATKAAAHPAEGAKSAVTAAGQVRLHDLPRYTRSLLRIKVPVTVTLAEKRQPIRHIVQLGAGSIIQFDKSCEEMLHLAVGNREIATGEAVKVGEKFGLRITSMVGRGERFEPVRTQRP